VASRPALACRAFEPHAQHLFTTRSWALGDAAADGDRAWGELAAALGVTIVRARQVHGTAVLVRRAGDRDHPPLPDADIIADRRLGVVAAAHAGWRGLAAGVPRVSVDALARDFGSRPADLIAAVGPSIAACCYEVGPDVRERFEAAGWSEANLRKWFCEQPQPTIDNPSMPGLRTAPRPGHSYFHGGRAACDQLESAGVPLDQIFAANLCTASHPAALCSYRRDGAGAGRLAAVIRARV
jgi:YfiH family protein